MLLKNSLSECCWCSIPVFSVLSNCLPINMFDRDWTCLKSSLCFSVTLLQIDVLRACWIIHRLISHLILHEIYCLSQLSNIMDFLVIILQNVGEPSRRSARIASASKAQSSDKRCRCLSFIFLFLLFSLNLTHASCLYLYFVRDNIYWNKCTISFVKYQC